MTLLDEWGHSPLGNDGPPAEEIAHGVTAGRTLREVVTGPLALSQDAILEAAARLPGVDPLLRDLLQVAPELDADLWYYRVNRHRLPPGSPGVQYRHWLAARCVAIGQSADPDVLQRLLDRLESFFPANWAVDALLAIEDPSPFIESMQSSSADKVEAAAYALGLLGRTDREILRALRWGHDVEGDAAEFVLWEVVDALARLAPRSLEAVALLLDYLDWGLESVENRAARALGRLAVRRPRLRTTLEERARHPREELRRAPRRALHVMEDDSAETTNLDETEGQEKTVEPRVMQLARDAGQDPLARAALLDLLRTSRWPAPLEVLTAIARAAPPHDELVDAVLEQLGQREFRRARAAAARALGDLGARRPDVLAALNDRLLDPIAAVRLEAACTLAQFGEETPGVIKGVLEAFSTGEGVLSPVALARRLRGEGSLAERATTVLQDLLPRSQTVRRVLAEVLEGQRGPFRLDRLWFAFHPGILPPTVARRHEEPADPEEGFPAGGWAELRDVVYRGHSLPRLMPAGEGDPPLTILPG